MELSSHHITRLKNGNFLFNDKEIGFREFPRPIIFEMFKTECADLPDKFKKELSTDDIQSLTYFIEYAERNGYQFPAIPPKELFLRYEAEHTYYKLGDPFPREITRKRGERIEDEGALLRIHEFIKLHNLMENKEWEKMEREWREKLRNETETTIVQERKPIEEHGKKVIDLNQQTRQDEVNKLIRAFYGWIAKYVK